MPNQASSKFIFSGSGPEYTVSPTITPLAYVAMLAESQLTAM